VLLGIPTYFDVIKTPMDLGTVLTRLTRKQYVSAAEVLRGACPCALLRLALAAPLSRAKTGETTQTPTWCGTTACSSTRRATR
jgi:hypothetical protein